MAGITLALQLFCFKVCITPKQTLKNQFTYGLQHVKWLMLSFWLYFFSVMGHKYNFSFDYQVSIPVNLKVSIKKRNHHRQKTLLLVSCNRAMIFLVKHLLMKIKIFKNQSVHLVFPVVKGDKIINPWFLMWSCCSVTKTCPTPFNPMNCSMPEYSVLHNLLEFTQIPVHWVSDAI